MNRSKSLFRSWPPNWLGPQCFLQESWWVVLVVRVSLPACGRVPGIGLIPLTSKRSQERTKMKGRHCSFFFFFHFLPLNYIRGSMVRWKGWAAPFIGFMAFGQVWLPSMPVSFYKKKGVGLDYHWGLQFCDLLRGGRIVLGTELLSLSLNVLEVCRDMSSTLLIELSLNSAVVLFPFLHY